MNMNAPKFHNFNKSFQSYKQDEGIQSDTGEVLEGLWSAEKERDVRDFEKEYPGINAEFKKLIELLPDADNVEKGEFPFAGAVLRKGADGKMEVLARATNRVNERRDSTQHAELAVIQDAQQVIGDKHLDDCILISTSQPCEMCAGGVRNTKVGTVVYGVSQAEMRGKHVRFKDGFKPIRTVPDGFDIDALLRESGINVFAGYKHKEVLAKLTRLVGTMRALYEDPDAQLS